MRHTAAAVIAKESSSVRKDLICLTCVEKRCMPASVKHFARGWGRRANRVSIDAITGFRLMFTFSSLVKTACDNTMLLF